MTSTTGWSISWVPSPGHGVEICTPPSWWALASPFLRSWNCWCCGSANINMAMEVSPPIRETHLAGLASFLHTHDGNWDTLWGNIGPGGRCPGQSLVEDDSNWHPIPDNQKIKALHILVDKLDVSLAKPFLMTLYASKTVEDHEFPLSICMPLIPRIDTILNTKGWKNAKKLRACQNTWNSLKHMVIKMWEFELLDHYHAGINLLLWQAIMSIPHPTNKKFTLFHLIDKSQFEACHLLAILKSAKSYG